MRWGCEFLLPVYLQANTHSNIFSFSGSRCTPRLMERCASTLNQSMLKRLSSTTHGSSTTSRWERAVWVGEGTWERIMLWFNTAVLMLCVFTCECVLLCLFGFVCVRLKGACEWEEGPVVEGCQLCQASFALNEYLIKTLPFNSLSLKGCRASKLSDTM